MPKTPNRRKTSVQENNTHHMSIRISHQINRIHRRIHPTFPSLLQPSISSTAQYSFISHNCSHLPLARQSLSPSQPYRHSLGYCNVICLSCRALHWIQERSYKSTIDRPLFFACCQQGQISLPAFPDAPEPLNSLLQDDTLGN